MFDIPKMAAWFTALFCTFVKAECEWIDPGRDPYTGTVKAAIDRFVDVPEYAKTALKSKIGFSGAEYDHVLITKDSATGEKGSWLFYNMNFGSGRICKGRVNTSGWKEKHQERALIYCAFGECVAKFSVCRNISRAILISPKITFESRLDPPDVLLQLPPISFVEVPGYSDTSIVTGGSFDVNSSVGRPYTINNLNVVERPTFYGVTPAVPLPPIYLLLSLGLPLAVYFGKRFKQ